MRKQVQKISFILAAFGWFVGIGNAKAQVSLAGGAYQETFDGMGASGTLLPTGWFAVRLSGSGTANEPLNPIVTDGDVSSGAVYNVGPVGSTERALGSLSSGTTAAAFGASLKNTSAGYITKLEIAGFMEQWKAGSRADQLESLVFEYSTNATSLISGTWTAVASLNLIEKLTGSTTTAAVNGNDAANRTPISGTINATLAQEATIWFRWKDTDVIGSDGLYAVDDLVITPTYSVVDNTAPTLTSSTPASGGTNVATQLDLVLRFSEPVIAGTGQITLIWAGGGSLSVQATDPAVQYSGNEVTIRDLSLQPGLNYTVGISSAAFTDLAGNPFSGITGTSLTFTTSNTGTPVLSTNKEVLSFLETEIGTFSPSQSYSLSATYMQGNVTLGVTGPYQISKTDNPATFNTTDLVFTPSELASAKEVYVRFAPTATTTTAGTITHSSAGAQTVSVALNGLPYSAFAQDFNNCGSALPGGWVQYSVTGIQTWNCTTFGRTGNAVQMSGFAGSNMVNEDWLISPALNLSTGFTYPLASFWSRTAFAGAALKLMVSVNYSGSGNPNAAGVVWAEINGMFPGPQSDVWTRSSVDLSAYKQNNVHLAFVYNSSLSAAPRWTIDDFEISNSTTVPPAILTTNLNALADADFGVVASGTVADKTFSFSVQSLYSSLTIEAPENFMVSKNGTDFARSITYSQAEGAANSIFVRFIAPAVTEQAFAGAVSFKADNLNVQTGYLTAAVLNKDNTFDVVTWNIEWFGAPNQGPTNEALQRENVKKVMDALDADVFAFQEISNKDAFDDLKELLPAYEGFMSDYSSGSQEVAYFYKKSTVREIKRQYLLKSVTGISNFWASGRYPYLLEVDATINGVTKRLHLLNIHAKANENGSPEEALTAYNRRKEDVRVLKDSLDLYYATANIIMLGDYNDDIDVTVADITSPTSSTYAIFVEDAARYTFPTMSLSEAGLRSYVTRDNVIDHIMYSNELANFYISNSARIDIPFEVVGATTAEEYTNTTSDHLPTLARFTFSNLTSLEDENIKAGFNLYPNPTSGPVALQLPKGKTSHADISVIVYGLRGELLLQASGTEQYLNEQLTQKLKGFATGLYLVKVQVGEQTYQARIIKN